MSPNYRSHVVQWHDVALRKECWHNVGDWRLEILKKPSGARCHPRGATSCTLRVHDVARVARCRNDEAQCRGGTMTQDPSKAGASEYTYVNQGVDQSEQTPCPVERMLAQDWRLEIGDSKKLQRSTLSTKGCDIVYH